MEDYVIKCLNLVLELKKMAAIKLQEKILDGMVEKAATEKLEENEMNLIEA